MQEFFIVSNQDPELFNFNKKNRWYLRGFCIINLAVIKIAKGSIMESFHELMGEYQLQMEKGVITKAYKGLMDYIMDLKTYLKNKYPDYSVSGSLYLGYMDMTYFAFFPEPLKQRNLKVAIVFVHEAFRFEVWLAGFNKQVQSKYWKLFKESNWQKYHLVDLAKGVDSIVEHELVADPDFSDLDGLTHRIETETMQFIEDVEGFLSSN